jgi:hypothetical protein
MGANKFSNRLGAGDLVRPNCRLAEPHDSPAFLFGLPLHTLGARLPLGQTMPVVAIGFNGQSHILKHKVRLPVAEKRLVHFKLQSALREFVIEGLLDTRHLDGKPLGHPEGSQLRLLSLTNRPPFGAGYVKLFTSCLRVQRRRHLDGSDDLLASTGIGPHSLSLTRQRAIRVRVGPPNGFGLAARRTGSLFSMAVPSRAEIARGGAITATSRFRVTDERSIAPSTFHSPTSVTILPSRAGRLKLCSARYALLASIHTLAHGAIIPRIELSEAYCRLTATRLRQDVMELLP